MMQATSETGYYLLELAKLLVVGAPIALILVGAVLFYRAAPSRPLIWLIVATALWLVTTFFSRLAISSPVLHHYMSGTFATSEAHQAQMDRYLATQGFLWTAEQVFLFTFEIALFFVFRIGWRASKR